MAPRPEPSRDALLRALALLKTVQAAATLDEARETVLATALELTRADLVFWIERDARDRLSVTQRVGVADPTDAEVEKCLDEAKAALERYADRRRRAAETGREVRNPGTDEGAPLACVAKVLWSGEQLFGVLAIGRRREETFTEEERSHFTTIAEQAAAGLAKRHVAPPRSPAAEPDDAVQRRLVAEAKTAKSRRITRSEVESLLALARGTFAGEGVDYLRLLRRVGQYAPSGLSILVLGESGTGKEQLAHLLHRASPRHGAPFVAVNAAAVTPSLFEAQLFGHKKGSFTGATTDSLGYVRRAAGGTLFLDEIGELAEEAQVKLLRVLQEKKVTPVGETDEVAVDFRLVAATNRPLEELVAEGKFRKDLYYRLCQLQLRLPPLRERLAELPIFVEHFLAKTGGPLRRRNLSADAWAALRAHEWPGNLRELENVVLRAVVVSGDEDPITARHLEIVPLPSPRTAAPAPVDRRRSPTREEITRVLEENGGNRTRAAEALGIDRRTLQRILGRED